MTIFSATQVQMLEQFCSHSKQNNNNVVMLSCAKSGCCESSHVTSPLNSNSHVQNKNLTGVSIE